MTQISLSAWQSLLRAKRCKVGNIVTVINKGATKLTASTVTAACRLGVIDPELNRPLRAVLSKVGITTIAQLAASITNALRAARKSLPIGERSDFNSSTTVLFSPKLLTLITKTLGKYYSLESGKYAITGPLRPGQTQISNPLHYTEAAAYAMCVVYSFITLKLCTFYKLDPVKHKLPILMYLMFGKPSPEVPPQVKAMFGKEVKAKQDPDFLPGSELGDLALTDVTPELLGKYGHQLVDKLPKLFDALAKKLLVPAKTKIVPPEPAKPQEPPPGSHVSKWDKYYDSPAYKKYSDARTKIWSIRRFNLNKPAEALNAARDLALTRIHPEVAALIVLTNKKANKHLREFDRDNYQKLRALKLKLKVEKSLIARLTREGKDTAAHIKYRDDVLKEIDALETAGASTKVAPWMIPFLPEGHQSKALIQHRDSGVKVGKGLLTHMLVDKANKGLIRAGDPELKRPLDSAAAQLLSLGALSNIIEDGYSGKSARAFRHVFRRVVEDLKGRVFAMALLSKKVEVKAVTTQLGVVDNKRLLRLNRFKDTDITSLIAQNKKVIAAWDPTAVDVKSVAGTIKEKAKRETAYSIAKVDKVTLDAWNTEVRQYMTGKHNVDVQVLDGWTVHLSAKAQALVDNLAGSDLKVVKNVFHGTAKQTGGIILTYGFKISGTQVTGRSMGDVLYLAPNIDKSAQYLSPRGGWTRVDNTVGIIFMGDAIVSGSPGDQASSSRFGWTKIGRFQTEEIGLTNPNAQFVIRRVFLIGIREDHGIIKNVSGSRKFDRSIPIAQWLAEWKANNG